MKGIMTKVMALLALLTILSPTLWAQDSAEAKVIKERTAALVAATKELTAARLEAAQTQYLAKRIVLTDQAEALQNPHPTKTTTRNTLPTASLTGKVFAITKSGDVKPALLAPVYFFPMSYSINEWIMSNIRARGEYEAKVKAVLAEYPSNDPFYLNLVTENCRDLLSDLDKGINDSKQSSPELFGPAYTTETDETGSFKIARVKVGDYLVVVRGQAGYSDVLWIDKFKVVAGTNALKLSSVAEACKPK